MYQSTADKKKGLSARDKILEKAKIIPIKHSLEETGQKTFKGGFDENYVDLSPDSTKKTKATVSFTSEIARL